MTLSADELTRIVERSSTIRERGAGSFAPVETAPDVVAQRLRAWRDAAAGDDESRFAQRLSWDGLDLDSARLLVHDVRLVGPGPLPAWATLLGELAEAAACAGGPRAERAAPVRATPFEELLEPLVAVAVARLEDAVGVAWSELPAEARRSLEGRLLSLLSELAGEVLLHEFDRRRGEGGSGLARLVSIALEPDSRRLYLEFVDSQRSGGFAELLRELPMFARRLAVLVERWIEATGEMLVRLREDLPELERRFSPLGVLADLSAGLSDNHNGHRTVCILSFASGRKLVYKPKDVSAEQTYYDLLAWLNAHGPPLPLRVLTVLNRGSHGWVEYVGHDPCDDDAQAERYFRRAGMLLCLAYCLEATDCHFENLIASGEHPMLVDLETVMHHRIEMRVLGEGPEAQVAANEMIEHSVLRTGLLPHWEIVEGDGVAFDVSGLGAAESQPVGVEAPRWEHANTDRMAIVMEPGQLAGRRNVPYRDGAVVRLQDHVDEVLAGFTGMYEFVVAQRDAMLAPGGPLAAAASRPVRFVFRPTRSYALMQLVLQARRCLRDGVAHSIQLEALVPSMLPPAGDEPLERPDLWPLLRLECEALLEGDVPFFTARADSDGLDAGEGARMPHCFAEPSFDRVVARLRSLGERDHAYQRALIQGSLYGHGARAGSAGPATADGEAGTEVDPIGDAEALNAARAIAERIAATAIRSEDGGAAWIAPQYIVRSERYQLQPLDYDLYGGTTGVALFLAALVRVTGSDEHRDLALGALASLRWALRAQPDELASMLGIGGGTGLGSVVYGLVRIAELLEAPELLDDARTAATLITDTMIEADSELDLISGSAGALLALLALHDAGVETAAARAAACGRHLLARRERTPAGPRSWRTFHGQFTTGMAHGAAGIAYSLGRLHALTGDSELSDAGREAIAYEDSMYTPDTGNWADFGEEDDPLYVWSWCHGAPGIGLARAAGLDVLDDEQIRTDLRLAVDATEGFGLRLIDHLCCGNMGRSDVLLTAAHGTGQLHYEESARRLAAQVVQRAELTGGYLLHPLLPEGVHNPSLFQGTAGVGYQLLRIAHPGLVPSVLSLA